MRGKTWVSMLTVLMFLTSLAMASMPVRYIVRAQGQTVKVYVYQPLGYIPFATPGGKVTIEIRIETSGIPDYVAGGIAGWGLNLRVDPNVLDINTTGCAPPTCIPPIPANATAVQGNFMPTYAGWYGISTLFAAGGADPLTGYWPNIADALNPNPGHGAGDGFIGMGYDLLVTLEVTSKSDTQPCLIDIVSVYYKLGDASVHAADIVEDGYYGALPPPVASFTYSPSKPAVDETVTFNATASYDPDGGDIVSYEWDFDDETTGTGNTTTHAYTETGTYTVTLNVTDDEGLWDTESKNVTVCGPPVASFTYSPSEPNLGETIIFNASASHDPDGGNETYPSGIVSYEWDFGDKTTGTGDITTHKYFEAETYTVTLNVTDDEGLTGNTTATVTVSGAAGRAELHIEVVVGSIHFRGETAESYILTSFMGEPVNVTQINAMLYHDGTLYNDLSDSVENVTTGLYRVPYAIPLGAPVGTYVLVVNASFFTQKGISLSPPFLLSPTLTGWNALLISIDGTVGTIETNVGLIEVKLDSINATLINVNGTVATINSTIGLIAADVSTIDAKVTHIEGDVATIESTLGSIEDDIEDINGEISDIDGTLVTIQTDIGEIQTDVTAINARLTAINKTVGIVGTDVGSIEVKLEDIDATIVDIQDGLVTINSTLGDIQLDLADVKEDVTLELVGVLGDIEEGLANVTAAITDAEGHILFELGQVEVKLEDINATLTNIEGNLVTIKTDVGTINGTITSIQGDIATIETGIGVIEAAPTSFTIVAEALEELTDVTTSSITTPAGTFSIMVLTNSTLEDPVTFSDNTLTIIVSGQTGTRGVLNVMIPKQLLVSIESHIEEFAVTINGRPVSFTYTEETETYVINIVYTHSTQIIKIYLVGSQPSLLPLQILLAVALAIAVATIVTALCVLRIRKKSIKPESLFK